MSKNDKYVVYEYTEKAGVLYAGCRYYTSYTGEDGMNTNDNTIVVAKNIDESIAVRLVDEVATLNMLTYSFEMASMLASLHDIEDRGL